MTDPVLAAILDAAADATGAAAGWVVTVVDGGRMLVRAVAGDAPDELVGTYVTAGAGAAGYVVASAQPLALASRTGDPRAAEGLASALGRPPGTVLCVPCETANVVAGALELVDKAGGGSFSFDDVELATLLAGIAGVALTSTGDGTNERVPPPSPSPSELAHGLARLAADEPARYTAVAEVVATLVASDGMQA